jgi:glycerophosphoryl diester phosphodiesterase
MSETQETPNRLRQRLAYISAFILLLHCLFFFVYWVAVGGYRGDVDRFIGQAINFQLPYVTIIMVLTGIVGAWSLARVLRFRISARKKLWKKSVWNWVFLVVLILFLALIYGAFVMLLREDPSQKGILLQLFNLARLLIDPIIFLFIAVWLRRLILFLRRKSQSTVGERWPCSAGIVLALVSLVGLWLLSILNPPNWVYQGGLPTRPALIAHRGASMLAPENTLAAAELAYENEALGFETDLMISLDGVPFLMHDETLARTTNIAEVFPDRVDEPASNFTMDELKQLNAGLWFIQSDPYNTISDGYVSQAQLAINQGQTIPTLAEALAFLEQKGMVVMFDMRYPSPEHPFYDTFFDIVLTTCRESGMNGNVWFLVDREHLPVVIENAPQMTRVIGASSSDLPAAGELIDLQYEIVNVDTGITAREIRAYREQGLGVNVYTIDEPWLFSQFWLTGVTSVTTNNVQTFSQLTKPFINIPYSQYLIFWGLFGIIIAIWIAASQPEPEKETARPAVPNLLDFADSEENTLYSSGPDRSENPLEQVKDAGKAGIPAVETTPQQSPDLRGAPKENPKAEDEKDK